MSASQKRKCFLDPCHSKNVNVSKLQLSRMKLKMKLELRTLKKITEEVVHEGDSYVVVVPANVYENPLDTIPIQSHEGIIGCYGSATAEQLKMFYGDNIPKSVSITKGLKNFCFKKSKLFIQYVQNITSEKSSAVEKKIAIESPKFEQESPPVEVAGASPDESLKYVPTSCPVDEIELQNAIWNITPDLNLENPTVPSDQMSFDDFLMGHTGDDNSGVLFDLS